MSFNLFVPGRICLFGEHSDHMSDNGLAITFPTDLGIFSRIKKRQNIQIIEHNKIVFEQDNFETINLSLFDKRLHYILGAINIINSKFPVEGISIEIIKNTLPEQKSLSSSAAVILTIIKAYNKLYDLNLSLDEEESLGVKVEHSLDSFCGNMDYKAINEGKLVLLDFKNNSSISIKTKAKIYFIIIELSGVKKTKTILQTLKSNQDLLTSFFEKENIDIIDKAKAYLENNDLFSLGELMNYVQSFYIKNIYPLCSEFGYHQIEYIFNDPYIKRKTMGIKSNGSHGLGSLLVLVDKDNVTEVNDYINNTLKLKTYIQSIY